MQGKTAMPGMKRDCGGAAGILGAFYLAVKQGFSQNLHAIFCLAENAVCDRSTRPDDIHTLYSGKTVEINNTDAEGMSNSVPKLVYDRTEPKPNSKISLKLNRTICKNRFHRYRFDIQFTAEIFQLTCLGFVKIQL